MSALELICLGLGLSLAFGLLVARCIAWGGK